MKPARTPCNDPANDPEDWFISKNGRQYADEALVSEEYADIIVEWAAIDGVDPGLALELTEELLVKDALVRRRHAKDACFTQCYFRTQCLQLALDGEAGPESGTWGGYLEEELHQIRTLRRQRLNPVD